MAKTSVTHQAIIMSVTFPNLCLTRPHVLAWSGSTVPTPLE